MYPHCILSFTLHECIYCGIRNLIYRFIFILTACLLTAYIFLPLTNNNAKKKKRNSNK